MKKIISLIFITIITVSIGSTSFAYIYWGGGNVSAVYEIEDRLTTHYIFENSQSAWNCTSTPVWITSVPGSGHSWAIDGQYGDEWYGCYTIITRKYIFWGRATKFKIELNRTLLVGESDNFWQSVLVHEFGHSLCLGDNPNPSVPNSSIMNYARNRNTLLTPQTDDISGVNYAY